MRRGGGGARHDRFRSPATHTQEPGQMEGDPMPSHAGPAGRPVRRFFLNRASSWPGEWRIHRVKPFPVAGDPATTLRRLRNAVAYRDGDRKPSARGLPDALPQIPGRSRVSILSWRACRPCPVGLAVGPLRLRREPAAGRTGAKGASRLIRLSELPTERLRQGKRGRLTRAVAVASLPRATVLSRPASSGTRTSLAGTRTRSSHPR